MTFDYTEYEAIFNRGDDDALLEKYFDEEIIFSGSSSESKGKPALKTFLDRVPMSVNRILTTGTRRDTRVHETAKCYSNRQQNVCRNRHGFSLYRVPCGLAVCKIATGRHCQRILFQV
jgi:hypothetical protein